MEEEPYGWRVLTQPLSATPRNPFPSYSLLHNVLRYAGASLCCVLGS